MKVSHYLDTKAVKELPGVMLRDVIRAEDGTPHFVLRIFEVAPGSATEVHSHWWEHEIFVLSGRGRVKGREESAEMREGTVILIPSEEPHQFVNDGSQPLRYILLNPLKP